MVIEHINYTDPLNVGTDKLNASIDQSNKAIDTAETAKTNSSNAINTANSVQEQFNQVVIEGDSSVEAAQARVDLIGNAYPNLKERIDAEQNKIEDIAVNVKKFGVTTIASSNNVSFSSALNSDLDSLVISKGIYRITDTIKVNSGATKKIFGTRGAVILVDLPSSKTAIDIFINIEFNNITFDFNNKPVNIGLFFRENIGRVTLKNCKFINVKDMDSTTSTTIVYVANQGNELDIDGIKFENMLKKGNGNITDGAGSLNGLYVGNTNVTGVLNGGVIRNVDVKEFHNIDANENIIFEDTAAVYLAGLSSAKVTLENVNGYNFGKRLIKTQVSNLMINNIKGESYKGDSLSVLSVMDSDNVIINNIQAFGQIGVAVGASCTNSIIDNVAFYIDKATLVGPNSFGIQLGADNITVRNLKGKAERHVVWLRTDGKPFKNITIDGVNVTMPAYGVTVFQFLSNSEGFDGLTINNVTVDNESAFSSNYVSVFDTYNLNVANKSSKNLTINNLTLNSKYVTPDYERIMNLYKITGVTIQDITFTNNNVNRAYRGLYIEGCNDVRLRDLDIKAYVTAACQIKDCNDVSVRNVKTNTLSNYVATVANSTKVKFSEADPTRILLNDQLSIQNTTYEKQYSMGSSNNRPTSPLIPHEHFDTTLGKPIFWNGSVWKDMLNNTV